MIQCNKKIEKSRRQLFQSVLIAVTPSYEKIAGAGAPGLIIQYSDDEGEMFASDSLSFWRVTKLDLSRQREDSLRYWGNETSSVSILTYSTVPWVVMFRPIIIVTHFQPRRHFPP